MEILLEIVIYLLVVLGLITVCFTFFSKFSILDNIVEKDVKGENIEKITYARNKREDSRLIVNIRYKNIEKEELEKIKETIEKGEYNNIIDLADEVNYIDANKKNKRK